MLNKPVSQSGGLKALLIVQKTILIGQLLFAGFLPGL